MKLERIELRPPLRLMWAMDNSFASVRVSDDDVAYVPLTRKREGLAAVASDGRVLWTRPAKGPGTSDPQPLPGGRLVTAGGAPKFDTLSVLDASTGAVLWTGGYLQILPIGAAERECVGIEWAIAKGHARVLGLSLPPDPKVHWERVYRVAGRPRRHVSVAHGPRSMESLFLLDRTRPDQPAVLALDPHTGEERWRAERRLLPAAPRTDGDWRAALAEGDRLIYRTEEGLACVNTHTGQGLWAATVPRQSTVYRDVIVATQERTVWALSSETGRYLRKKDLTKALSARHPSNELTIGCAVSETHVFVCDQLGTLWALDRETLEPVWSHCPAGTVGGLNSPQIIRRRIYANTVSWKRGVPNHLYCWGPAKEGESPGPSDTDVTALEGVLAFTIVEVLPRKAITSYPPFHEGRGAFSVYRCRFDNGGAEFFFGDRVARGGGLLEGAAAALWVGSVEDGELLLKAFREAMPPEHRMKKAGKPVRPSPPTALKGVDLAGRGKRQRRKWNSLDEEAELLVEWDTDRMRGVFLEKDNVFREGVLQMITDLLVRG